MLCMHYYVFVFLHDEFSFVSVSVHAYHFYYRCHAYLKQLELKSSELLDNVAQ